MVRLRVSGVAVSAWLVMCATVGLAAEVRYRIVRLGGLGLDPVTGSAGAEPGALNDAGTVVGGAAMYGPSGLTAGVPVRWDVAGVPAALANTLLNESGRPESNVLGVSAVGTAAGYVGTPGGARAARWDLGTGAVTVLDTLGTNFFGQGYATAMAMNESGVAVGYARKVVSGDYGDRAVRWDPGSTAVTELKPISIDPRYGGTAAIAFGINGPGTVVGQARDSRGGGSSWVDRAVKWESGSVEPTILPVLTAPLLTASAAAYGINDAGVIVGVQYGMHHEPVRWETDGTVTLLGRTLANGTTLLGGVAKDVNGSGTVVGRAGNEAVVWREAGSPERLMDLIEPGSGWTALVEARAINESGWIVGRGRYGPPAPWGIATDGFLLMPVPEPAGMAVVLAATGVGAVRRRRG